MPVGEENAPPEAPIGTPVVEVLESISDAFFALDRGWRFTYLNGAAERLLVRPRGGLIGQVVWEQFPDAVGSTFEREYRRAAHERVTVRFEEFFPPLGAWFDVRAYPTPSGLSVYFQDSTERRRMQEALRFSEERHRTLFETMVQGVVYQDADGRIEGANPAAEQILGVPRLELAGRLATDPSWAAVREDGSEIPPELFPSQIALATGKPVLGVLVGLTHASDGARRWVRVNSVPLFRGGGDRPDQVYTVFEDVSDLKHSQHALEHSERRYRSLVTATSSVVWTADLGGGIAEESPSWEAFTGQTWDQYRGDGWLSAVHPEDREATVQVWRRALASLSTYEAEYRLIGPGGAYRRVLSRGAPVLGRDGALREWVGTCNDVTSQREAEAQLREARDEAERLSEAKNEFIAVVSHELRTPLTPVLLTVSLIESHPDLPDDLREDLASIRRNVELESRLIGDLLDLTRIARGVLPLDRAEVDVHLAVRTAVEICRRDDGGRLVVDLAATRHHALGDATRLQQVVWNLVNNALKFTGPGGRVTVRSSDAPGDRVRIEVADTGVGIEPHVLPRLFNAFEQGDARSTQAFAGLGLGLAVTKKLVEAHGGTVSAFSAGKGRGATFVVELPTVAATAVAAEGRKARPLPDGPPLRVLLVEDHEATLRALTRHLHRLGHTIGTASSVESALARAGVERFDILVSDLGLPDGSGLDLIRKLKGQYSRRSIALTGYGTADDVRRSMEAGFAEHLTKPVDPDTLTEVIRRLAAEPSTE